MTMILRRAASALEAARLAATAPVLVLIFAAGLDAAALHARKISSDLRKVSRETLSSPTEDVIIQFRGTAENTDLENVSGKGGLLKRKYMNFPAAAFRVPADALDAIAADPEVVYISPDRSVTGSLEFAAPAVGADIAFSSGWTGEGVGIAVVDSGINPDHPDVKGRVVYAESFVPNDTRTGDPYGHGTHVGVIAAGDATASTGPAVTRTFRGIAPGANLISLRALDASGSGSDSSVIAAIDRAIELKSLYNIRVLNLSLGRTIRESYTLDPLCLAVRRAWNAGIVVVVAAGNNGRDNSLNTSGYGTIASPANSPWVITVGAMKDMGSQTRADDLMATYSSKGPTLLDHVVKPDLVAPGNSIISGVLSGAGIRAAYPDNAVPLSYYKNTTLTGMSGAYFRLNGTSMAAPMVSGAAALLLQKNPQMTPDQVKARLMKTASKAFPSASSTRDPLTGEIYRVTYDLFTVGAGYLDIQAALNNSQLSSGPALSPVALYDSAAGSTSIAAGPSSAWANAVVWGTAVVWGSNTNAGFAVVWGSDTVWPNSHAFPNSALSQGEI